MQQRGRRYVETGWGDQVAPYLAAQQLPWRHHHI